MWDDVDPPAQIIEDYFKCKANPTDSIINGTGVAVGISTIVVPALVILTMPLIYIYLHFTQSEEETLRQKRRVNMLHAENIGVMPEELLTNSEPEQPPDCSQVEDRECERTNL